MPVVSVGPDYLDAEVACLIKLLGQGGWLPHEASQIDKAIQQRSEVVRSGLTTATGRYWTQRIQREVDDRTRMRWDHTQGWVLDRWAMGCWEVVGVFGFNHIREWLIDYLRERDMQRWSSPQEYLEHKRLLATKKCLENEYQGVQKLLGVVDRMSNKRIREFIVTERAMQTGETITLHGESHRIFARMVRASRRSPAPPSGKSINPGMHPFKYVRNYKGGKYQWAL